MAQDSMLNTIELPIELYSDRLIFRPWQLDHLDALHHLFIDSQVRQYLCDDKILPQEWVVAEIEQSLQSFVDRRFGLYSLFLKDDPTEFVGCCGYRYFFDEPEPQLLYALLPAYWHQGYATEAAQFLICHAFQQLGFERVVTAIDAPNHSSIRVVERAGMQWLQQVEKNGASIVYYAIYP